MSDTIRWEKVTHFEPHEFDYPEALKPAVVYCLDTMVIEETARRERIGAGAVGIRIHSDYRPGDRLSHGKGEAVDFDIFGRDTGLPLPVVEQYFMALHYPWCGLGFYPFWNRPGLHADHRRLALHQRRATWWRDDAGLYRAVYEHAEVRRLLQL